VALAKATRTPNDSTRVGTPASVNTRPSGIISEPDPSKILESAFSHWSSDREENSGGSDCDLPATRALFRGCDNPFEEAPEDVPDWLPAPGTPLAWRLMLEIDTWQAALNPTTA
jgi:hypothetical protein